MERKVLAVILCTLFLCGWLSDCGAQSQKTPAQTGEFPKIKLSSGSTDIEWVIGINRLGNAITDREDNLTWLMKDQQSGDLVYLKNKEFITIKFDGKSPDTVKLTEHIIKADGTPKYTTENEGTVIDITFKNGKGSFIIQPNYATALSSNSNDYLPGNTIKGYRLLCNWGTDECEYAFVIRGDAAITMNPPSVYVPQKVLDYFYDDAMPWESTIDFEITEFPDTKFVWTSEKIMADGEVLFAGMPVWNVFLADLNGDHMPEICSTISFGSGIVDSRVAVYDYFNRQAYDLSDRMTFDYTLSLKDGLLIVNQIPHPGGAPDPNAAPTATGSMAIVEGKLIAIGLDRAKPK
jgi:hypothetical protein